MTALLTADWHPYGKEEYFRKFEVYDMEWMNDVNMDTVTLTSTSFGGPIAVIRDRKKVVKVQGGGKPVITIFTSSGRLISSFVWSSGQIVQMGWSSGGDLLCVQEDGAVLIYDMFANYQHTFGMGQEVQDTKVMSAQIFRTFVGTGIAVLTTAHRVFLVNSVKEPKVRKLPVVPGINAAPTAWIVISKERHSRVLYARFKELYSLNEGDSHANKESADLRDDVYSIIAMAVTCNYEYLALLSDKGKLWFGPSDLSNCFYLFDTRNSSIPKNLLWCGEDAVVINWETSLEVIAANTDKSLHFPLDSSVFLVQEVDCVRIITPQTLEILQKVPGVVRDIFRINSTDPGSYLLEASKQFQKKSHRANEYLHLVKPQLSKAIKQCVEAAGHEFNTETQKMLMKAAQLGKTFTDQNYYMDQDQCFNPESFVTMCRVLRCLNGVRDPKIGIPLTYHQLQVLTVQGLLDCLVTRRHYYLALEIATFLKMPDTSKILSHWACYKVKQSNVEKEKVAKEIADKLGRTKGVSYAAIAMKASECGRPEIAIKLIDYEPRANRQVLLLLHLGQDNTALLKAIESGNTDLVYTVLLHLKENMPLAKFQMQIRNLPLAQALYIKYCKQHNKETLKDIYIQEDDHNSQAECFIRESYDPKNNGPREALLLAAQESFKKAKNDVNASFCEEQLKLLKYQRHLEEKFKRDVVGKSLHETVKLLLTINEVKLADKLRSEFKVPDRRYWWLRVQVLGELNEWAELEKLSKSKKSPIGYEPFVDICWEHDKRNEAQKYLPRVKEELKVKYLVKLGMMEEAAQLAFERRDLEALIYVRSKCDSSSLADKISIRVQQLSKK